MSNSSKGNTVNNGADGSIALPKIKSRSWKILIYVESAPPTWKKILSEEYNWKFIVSPLHDKDVWTEDDEKENPEHKAGGVKKPHWHVLVLFDGETSINTVWDVLQKLNAPRPMKLSGSPVQFERYMIHRGFPDKYQYDEADMEAYGGAVIKLDSPEDDERIYDEIVEFLELSAIFSYFKFVCYTKRTNREWYNYVRTHTFPIQALLSSKFQDKKLELQAREKQATDIGQLVGEALNQQDLDVIDKVKSVVEEVQKE